MPIIVINKPGAPQLKTDSWEANLLGSIGNTQIRHCRVCTKSANLHKHLDADEAFFMLRGEMILEIEGTTIVPDMAELIVIDNIE